MKNHLRMEVSSKYWQINLLLPNQNKRLMKGSYTVEPASPPDFEEITSVWEASVRATHHFLDEEAIQYYRPLVLHEYLKSVTLFCSRDDHDRIVGFLGISGRKLEMLFIKPDNRGKGIGELLLNYAIDIMGIDSVDVNEQNEQAIGFYKRYGFKITRRSEVDGLGKPYPVLHMKLDDAG